MTNYNRSNQWKKFPSVKIFYLIFFTIFLKWNNVMLFLFQIHQDDSGWTYFFFSYLFIYLFIFALQTYIKCLQY